MQSWGDFLIEIEHLYGKAVADKVKAIMEDTIIESVFMAARGNLSHDSARRIASDALSDAMTAMHEDLDNIMTGIDPASREIDRMLTHWED